MQVVEPCIAVKVMVNMVRDLASQRADDHSHVVPSVVQEDRVADFAH